MKQGIQGMLLQPSIKKLKTKSLISFRTLEILQSLTKQSSKIKIGNL